MIFPTDFTFTGITTKPRTQFALDQLVRHWKANGATEEQVLAATGLPAVGDAHPLFPTMFVIGLATQETGPASCALDVTYMGTVLNSSGSPVMPPVQHESDNQVMSASSSRSLNGFTLSSPITVQFYAPVNVQKFFTYGAAGDASGVPDPTAPPEVITLQVGDTSYVPGGLISDIISAFFNQRVTSTFRSPEVVAGKFWQTEARKIMALVPFPFQALPGNYLVMFAPGQGYSVGNTLTMTDGTYTATIQVDALGIGNSVIRWTTLSNTFNYTTPTPIYVSGGSGTGAAFFNYHL